ncbi:hypothetical protein JCM11641_004001 [Rhodosporidiobolus odoratus]
MTSQNDDNPTSNPPASVEEGSTPEMALPPTSPHSAHQPHDQIHFFPQMAPSTSGPPAGYTSDPTGSGAASGAKEHVSGDSSGHRQAETAVADHLQQFFPSTFQQHPFGPPGVSSQIARYGSTAAMVLASRQQYLLAQSSPFNPPLNPSTVPSGNLVGPHGASAFAAPYGTSGRQATASRGEVASPQVEKATPDEAKGEPQEATPLESGENALKILLSVTEQQSDKAREAGCEGNEQEEGGGEKGLRGKKRSASAEKGDSPAFDETAGLSLQTDGPSLPEDPFTAASANTAAKRQRTNETTSSLGTSASPFPQMAPQAAVPPPFMHYYPHFGHSPVAPSTSGPNLNPQQHAAFFNHFLASQYQAPIYPQHLYGHAAPHPGLQQSAAGQGPFRFQAGRNVARREADYGTTSHPHPQAKAKEDEEAPSPISPAVPDSTFWPSPVQSHSTLATSPVLAHCPATSPTILVNRQLVPKAEQQQQPQPPLVSSSGGAVFGAASPNTTAGQDRGEEQEEKGQGKKRGGRMQAPENSYQIDPNTGVKPFVNKLRWLVKHPDEVGDAICWSDSGNEILVKIGGDTRITTDVLPRTYSHENLSAFYRQFTAYGFDQIKSNVAAILNPPTSDLDKDREASDWRVYQHHHTIDDFRAARKEERASERKIDKAKQTAKTSARGVAEEDEDESDSEIDEDEDEDDVPYWFCRDEIDNFVTLGRLKPKAKGKGSAGGSKAKSTTPAPIPVQETASPSPPPQQPVYYQQHQGGPLLYSSCAGAAPASVQQNSPQVQPQSSSTLAGLLPSQLVAQRSRQHHGYLGAAAPATGEPLDDGGEKVRFVGGTRMPVAGLLRGDSSPVASPGKK